jgi:RHS repeat-associated protein
MTIAQLGGSTIASYTYNALNERIQKTTGTATERYDYNEGSQLLGEYGATNRDYIWMGGIPVANVDTSGTTSTIAYVTADQLGTPRAIANSSGTTEWQNPYQGNPWNEVAPTSNGYTYNLRAPGQYFDVETDLFNNGFRDYDSATGREIESDPTGLRGGVSTYAYVGGNPLSYIDPLGLAQSLSYQNVSGGPTDPMWQIQWQLSDPSPNGGWIVQQIDMTLPDGSQTTYWEAWQVAPNSTVTKLTAANPSANSPMANLPIDDTFEGAKSITASARFYEGLNLPGSFVQGSVPYATGLRATRKNPCLSIGSATPPVNRSWKPSI